MDLRLALILLGIVLVSMVFAISRYSDKFEKIIQRLRSKFPGKSGARLRVKTHAPNWKRDTRHAPSIGESDENDQFKDPVFEFESDTYVEQENIAANKAPGLLIDEPVEELGQNSQLPEESTQEESTQLDADKNQADSVDEEGPEVVSTLRGDQEYASPKPAGPFTSLRQIDYWIKLSPASPVTQAKILAKLTHWDKIDFPVQLHALTQDEPHWVNLLEAQADTTIMDVVASYQLLNSGNAATIADLNTFEEQATMLGKALDAEKLMMATPEQALDQSFKLAQFYTDSCDPLEVSICAPKGQAFMGKLVETSAKQQGLDFMEGDYVRQKRMASHNVILYRMINHDSRPFDRDMPSDTKIECVKFTMMPALSRTPGRDAKEMLDAVKAFSSRVNGTIRIPGEAEYHQELLLKLRNRVSRLEKDTIAAGLEPGGMEIYRIFS